MRAIILVKVQITVKEVGQVIQFFTDIVSDYIITTTGVLCLYPINDVPLKENFRQYHNRRGLSHQSLHLFLIKCFLKALSYFQNL